MVSKCFVFKGLPIIEISYEVFVRSECNENFDLVRQFPFLETDS